MSSREKITTHIRKMVKKIKRLENIVNELKAVQQNNIGGNRLRDERITEIDNNLYSLRSFIREKLSNHPDDYLNYVRHTSNQLLGSNLDTTSVPSNDSLSGGRRKKRRKTRNLKNKSKRKGRKNKKTRKRKQKGRGANICQMLSHPDKMKEAISIAMGRANSDPRRIIPKGRRAGLRVAQLEAHHYCQEMNDWNDNYKCNTKLGSCAVIKTPEAKKAINDRLRRRGYK